MKKTITTEHKAWVEVARRMAEHSLTYDGREKRVFGLCFEVDTMNVDGVIDRHLCNAMRRRITENMDRHYAYAFPIYDRDVRVLAALFLAVQAAEGI